MQSLEAPLPQWSGRQAEVLKLKLGMPLSSRVQVCAEDSLYLQLVQGVLTALHQMPNE